MSTARFTAFFAHQRQMMEKFNEIERLNGFFRSDPFDLNARSSQSLMRRYAWQITEEVVEALHAYGELEDTDAFQEEVADVYHFLIEMVLVADMENDLCEIMPNDLDEHFSLTTHKLESFISMSPLDYWYQFIREIGMLMNSLKNRPWRTDSRPTDREKFLNHLRLVFMAFYLAAAKSDITPLILSMSYDSKAQINEKRYQEQKRRRS